MKSISQILKSLAANGYLHAEYNETVHRVRTLQLLARGKNFAEHLRTQWLNARNTNVQEMPDVEATTTTSTTVHAESRLGFVHTALFREHIRELRQRECNSFPTVIRYQTHNAQANADKLLTYSAPVTQLVTHFFVPPQQGLECFYNTQRESKIWWMRYSSNPSRYFIEPFELCAQIEGVAYSKRAQTLNIKARFVKGTVNALVEQLTLLPLEEVLLMHESEYLMQDMRTAKNKLPTVIRSIIELEPATCALLLDGLDHARTQALLLHRKLAPLQCAISCLVPPAATQDIRTQLRELCAHLAHVLQQAGLRLATEMTNNIGTTFVNDAATWSAQLQSNDTLGVPYVLLIEQSTLQHGLCKLRNRDTTLAETIHISDLPDYLLNIFRAT